MSYGDTQQLSERLTTRADPIAICAVACIDLAEYPKKPVREQMKLMERLDALLAQALAGVPVAERIVLDAGGGAAIVFPGSPEQCLAFASALAARTGDELELRVGLNVGPVRLIRSDSGRPAFVGDCLAVGRQIAAFADVGRIVASRSFYEAIVAVSGDYARRFAFAGTRTDSSVREHQLYSLPVDLPGAGSTATAASKRWPGRAAATARGLGSAAAGIAAAVLRRPPLATALVVALIVAGAAALRQPKMPVPTLPDRDTAAAPYHLPQAAAAPSLPALTASIPDVPALPATQAALPEPPALEPATAPAAVGAEPVPDMRLDVTSAAQPAAPVRAPLAAEQARTAIGVAGQPAAKPGVKPGTKPLPPQGAPARAAPAEPQLSEQAVMTGAVRLTVIPWGEVYLDGEKLGVAPPLRDVVLEPGVYRFEIRNPGFASLMQVVEVNAGEQLRIRHRFE